MSDLVMLGAQDEDAMEFTDDGAVLASSTSLMLLIDSTASPSFASFVLWGVSTSIVSSAELTAADDDSTSIGSAE